MNWFTSDQMLALLYSRAVENGAIIDRSVCACVPDLVEALKMEYSIDDMDASEVPIDLEVMLDLAQGICSISSDAWRYISQWAKDADTLTAWQQNLAFRIGTGIEKGHILGFRQAFQGKAILDKIRYIGLNSLDISVAGEVENKASFFSDWNARQFAFPEARRYTIAELSAYTRLFAVDEPKTGHMFRSNHLSASLLGRMAEQRILDFDSVVSESEKMVHCLQSKDLAPPIDVKEMATQIFAVLENVDRVSKMPPSEWQSMAHWASFNKRVPGWMADEAQRVGKKIEKGYAITPSQARTALSIIERVKQLGYVKQKPSRTRYFSKPASVKQRR